jgi:proline dehydrogenase
MPVRADLPLPANGHVSLGTQRGSVADASAQAPAIWQVTRRAASRLLTPIAAAASRSYIAGERLDDAMRVAAQLQKKGQRVCVGYWDSDHDSPEKVLAEYVSGCALLKEQTPGGYLSIKLPALRPLDELPSQLIEQARWHDVRIHFDAMQPETVEATRGCAQRLLQHLPAEKIGFTLPARWLRSVSDARWTIERGVNARVVKGQWIDPADPDRNLREAFMQVIDALAGRARHVAVASHDVELARRALQTLIKLRTSCELELLYGLPMKAQLALARELHVPVRVYVPYGQAFLPYAMSNLKRNPRIAWWLLRDLMLRRR